MTADRQPNLAADQRRYWTTRANSSGSSDDPPTSAPSISGIAMSYAAFPDFTLPPYWMRTASAVSAP